MTYRSRGRSIFEVVLAIMFTGFLIGFITVLCIGNYFRAKRAQERQKQRRLAKQGTAELAQQQQQQQHISKDDDIGASSTSNNNNNASVYGAGYEAPPLSVGNGVRA